MSFEHRIQVENEPCDIRLQLIRITVIYLCSFFDYRNIKDTNAGKDMKIPTR